jgi:hypothetical protein
VMFMAGRIQEKRVFDRDIIKCCVSDRIGGIETLVETRSEHVIVEGQPGHRGARREDLHPVRMGTAWVVAKGLEIVERIRRELHLLREILGTA